MAGNRNSGQRPKPTQLKKVLGFRPSRINEDEPKPPEWPVNRPESLSAPARVVWDELSGPCLAMGTLTSADVSSFATLCELEVTRRKASAEKDTPGFSLFLITTITDSAGNEHLKIQEHPAIKLERNTAGALRPYYEKFGLEPSGRGRLKVGKPQDAPEDKWAALGL
jgi:P27 family predicted phage terminase small subunit